MYICTHILVQAGKETEVICFLCRCGPLIPTDYLLNVGWTWKKETMPVSSRETDYTQTIEQLPSVRQKAATFAEKNGSQHLQWLMASKSVGLIEF